MKFAKFLTTIGVFLVGFAPHQPMWAAGYSCMKVSEALHYAIEQ